MKIVFCATSSFALPCLEMLNSNYDLLAVITQNAKPAGRGMKSQISPVGVQAIKKNISLLSPEKLLDIKRWFLSQEIDMVVVVSYGKILPKWFLNHPKYGCINVHASLLPLYRGAAPIHRSMLADDVYTGVSIMQMDAGLDTGGYWLQKTIAINNANFDMLHDQLANIGADALFEVINKKIYLLPPVEQNHSLASYANKIALDDFTYNNKLTSKELSLKVRSFYPKPGLRAQIGDLAINLLGIGAVSDLIQGQAGQILSLDQGLLWVATVDGAVGFDEIQLAGQKRRKVKELLNGWPKAIKLGDFIS